ncbi:hypothetical protein [Calothrix sp. UHCC 0171]|uniref:hypothetical protein n=1 Tax=Calothrix sp. UHCC 0171 TaxID=3110245 RepID=UPI002B1F15DD|nr:hypothetical protein [Calothrix sp. UHCC 0171]MEA5570603.1 hypothetical protein [Calothrix sp. UHCC 0171]
MTQLNFSQFIHPRSQFPYVANVNGDEPMLDLYTMAGLILYTACANNNQNARENALEVSRASARNHQIDVKKLFERCKTGDRAAILEMITLMVPGLQTRVEA